MTETLGAPIKGSGIDPLPCHRSGNTVLSAWCLTDSERLAIAKTGVVLVHIMGETHAPLAIGVLSPEEALPSDLEKNG